MRPRMPHGRFHELVNCVPPPWSWYSRLPHSVGRIRTGTGRRGAIVALVLGPMGLLIGGLVVATADGGLGSGNGLGGGVVAMMAGLVSMTFGGLTLARSRRPV